MKPSWTAEYRRWNGESTSVWKRRLTIARYGLKLATSGKVIKALLLISILQSVVLFAVFFFFGQLVSPNSALINWIQSIGGEEVSKVFNAITSWLLLYPEICVDGIYRLMFFMLRFSAPMLSLVMIALVIHKLVASDLANNAIVIYSSKALTKGDYILGKLCIPVLLLSVVWILPVLISWIAGNLLSPELSFYWHSFPALLRALALGIVASFSLSCIALAVSAVAGKSRAAVTYWILGWIVLSVAGGVASIAHPAFAFLNPVHCIRSLSTDWFALDKIILEAKESMPFFSSFMGKIPDLPETIPGIGSGNWFIPFAALVLMSVASIAIVYRKVDPS